MPQFDITIWGARGSLPASGSATRRYGGHTSCIEVALGDRTVILDAGSGIEPLGRAVMDRPAQPLDLVLSHAHYDHVIGLPFFAPLFAPDRALTLHYAGGTGAPDGPALLERLIAQPFLPFAPQAFRARLTHAPLATRGPVALGAGRVLSTRPVRHPGGSLALRLAVGGRSFVYVPDFEHDDGPDDAALTDFLRGADLALLDCTYLPEEYPAHRGMGHSHWARVAQIARDARVARWGVFHHAHTRSDAALDALSETLAEHCPEAFVAAQGMSFDLGTPG